MASNTPSSSKENSSTDPNSSTFTKMSIGDVEAIGAHCQMEYCRQLDFLPFRCESCHGKFCLDHRTEMAHECPKEGAWARARAQRNGASVGPRSMLDVGGGGRPNILTHEKQCADPACKTLIDTPLVPGVHCTTCNRRYCLKHRMKEVHDCANLTPLGARPINAAVAAQKEKGLAALEKLRIWGASRKAKTVEGISKVTASEAKKNAARHLLATNELKRAAKGDGKVAVEKRVYLHVEASADTTKAKFPTGKFFYSRDWTVGRVLDAAAKALQVENVNNRVSGEDQRLRVFHVEQGRVLEFGEKVGDVLVTGNTIVLLRGVGPSVPDLI